MRAPPPLTEAPRHPLTAAVGVAAIAATLYFWKGGADRLVLDVRVWRGESWRLLTSTLAHSDVLHLGFNLAWFWIFGTLIEGVIGQVRTAALLVYLAVVSAAAEFALLDGGIGLSGVVYGQFGLLWALQGRDRRFAGAVDERTQQLFVGWFVLCIFMTQMEIMSIGNVAHAFGALAGLAVGWSMAARARVSAIVRSSLGVALLGATLTGATVARPLVNISPHAAESISYLAYQAIERGDYEEGLALYREAIEFDPEAPDLWHNLAVCYDRLGRREEMEAAFEREDRLRADR